MDVKRISKEYFDWIKQNNHFSVNKDIIQLSTPVIDAFGDNINLILKQEGNKIKISDDAYVIWNIESHGLNITKKNSKRNNLLKSILSYDSINWDSTTNELYKLSSIKNIGQNIHDVIQSISKITDLMYLNKPTIKSLFSEDVFNYLKENKEDYDYFPNLQIIGQSKLAFSFDALFTTKNKVKKLSKFYNSFSKNTVENVLVSWLDTIQSREERFDGTLQMAVVINDQNVKTLSREYIDALAEYEIDVIPFSDKEKFKESLGA